MPSSVLLVVYPFRIYEAFAKLTPVICEAPAKSRKSISPLMVAAMGEERLIA
jgi:hypothetical protein